LTAPDPHRAIETVFRIESARLIAGLARMVRDVGLAEELAQEALVAALERWPSTGVPDNPGAWLMATAKNRAIDELRRNQRLARKHEELGHEIDAEQTRDAVDLLNRIEHAEPTVAQRIVRAKRTLTEAGVPFEVPRGADRVARLSSVLEVIYLIFNEGFTATAGDDWMRPGLCEDALRLGRILAELVPEEAEVHGLVALMEIQASRARARIGPGGEPVLLLDQDRSRWDQVLIGRGLTALARAEALGGHPGPYALQAAITACHARARLAESTDWARIAALYEALVRRSPSPVIELNRAVAVSMAAGPAAGLALVDALTDLPALAEYHLLPSVRGDLLMKLGRFDEARVELERAAALTRNHRERALLLARAAECSAGPTRS
jgi:RNA polymerase sigma-70 factor (ECF subfamily)